MDTRERHQHIRILERCADINNDSTTFDVRWALTDLIKASIPEANLRETFGLNGDPCHTVRILLMQRQQTGMNDRR